VTALFWTVAALFCVVAVAILLLPVWRQRRRDGRWSPVALAAAIVVAPLALGLYLAVSDWDLESAAQQNQQSAVVEGLIAELEAHLERNPTDTEGWSFLAGSYMQIGRYADGRAAYERLWALTPQPDAELKLAYAESQILTDRSSLSGEAGRLVEEALAARPGDPKGLWYGGLVALELGRDDAVRTRWTRLLSLNPPENVANIVRTQLAALGGEQGGAPAGASAESGPAIKLSVTLGEGRSIAALGPGAQLFIFASAPEGGPPLAAIRRPPTAVPGEFTISDADSMIAGRSIANHAEVKVVARLSSTGQPTPQPGDWFAEATVRPGDDTPVALVIDQVVQ
jgi:cytochrome c-type biogenesis protein CcmH